MESRQSSRSNPPRSALQWVTLLTNCKMAMVSFSSLVICSAASVHSEVVDVDKELEKQPRPFFALIEGMAGIGKSTLAQTITTDVKENKLLLGFSLLIHVNLQPQEVWNCQSSHDLLSYLEVSQADRAKVYQCVSQKPKEILFVIDEWDMFSSESTICKRSFITKIVKRELFTESSVILTSRPSACDKVATPDIHLRIEGLDVSRDFHKVYDFIRQCLRNMEIAYVDPLIEYLKAHQAVLHMCCNPGLAVKTLEVYKANRYLVPEAVTTLVNAVILKVVYQEQARKGLIETVSEPSYINKLPRNAQVEFLHGCKLAVADLLNPELDTMSVSHLLLGEGIAGLHDITGLGVIEAVSVPGRQHRAKDQPLYKFLHITIQEFMAAYYISQIPIVNQQKFFVDNLHKLTETSGNVCEFYFGLACQDQETHFNAVKLGLPCTVQTLVHGLTTDGELNVNSLFLILRCLYETQEPSLVKKCANKHVELLTMKLGGPGRNLTDHECSLTAFFIYNSGIQNWRCQYLTSEQKHKAEYLSFLCTSSSQTAIKVDMMKSSSTFSIEPIDHSKPTKISVYSPHFVYRKSIKDTLHRIFQFSSPVTVHSDCSEPGYTSYISCRCLQEAFNSSIILEPTQVMHCIDLPLRNKSKYEADNRHLKESHDSKRMEVIQLSTPYLNSVRFILPGTREEMLVKLSNEWEPSPMESRIAKEIGGDIFNEENLVQCSEHRDRTKPEVVVPDLPLPRKQRSNSSPKQNQTEHQEQGAQAARAEVPKESRAVTAEHLGATSQANGAFATQAIAVEQGVQQSSSKKQAAKPGTVLFSQMPHVMASEKVYALPDESVCIRRGGNGQIFIGTYAGVTMAIKKTVFRLREFTILTKLQHKNVIPLLILMVGEQHPQHRRRYFCYHFMPKMTGDCARMITDHESFTLKELQRSYGDNPRDMGMVLGNLRYILAEILRGLHYLHSCHIVHRDVKASNILIKMHCMHDNPLTCSCSNKCSVVVSDFDAAIELDRSDHLQPMQRSSQHGGSSPERDVFLVAPVGTLGFRAPECSMLSVSNSIEVIDPPLSTKADIWSLGMFLLRLLIGAEGPCSQREIAMLLLYYNHQRKQTRSVRFPSPRIPIISDSLLHRLLKFSSLREELKGVSSEAINFAKQCLKVDPDERESAQLLLQHPFLRVQPAHYVH